MTFNENHNRVNNLDSQKQVERIKYLVDILNEASKAYYAKDEELISNYEYDKLYDELVELEELTGVVMSNSPTVNVGYEAVDELPKERHESPMLSLDKTKSREALRDWLQGNTAILSWKLDGLTVVLSYSGGKLVKAVTRGNGEVGEVITNNAKTFKNLPLNIVYKGDMIIRGEAIITYSDFEDINSKIANPDEKYKNPRNLCSGSVRQLNNKITADRNVQFYAFNLVKADGVDFKNSKEEQYRFLEEQGFLVVERKIVDESNILETIEEFEKKIETYDVPSDGLVLTYDDINYGKSLGRTAKFPRDAIAFKWADDVKETTLKEIEWSPSRTGLINPVAIFEPVELEGTTVSRASVHNISVMQALELGVGDTVTVYKANMIIPQIAENLTRSNNIQIPTECPVCKKEAVIRKTNDVKSLYCTNLDCPAKQIKAFSLFASRDALNIDGISEATMEKFINMSFVKDLPDLFHLDSYRDEIINMEGFGEKSYANIIESVDSARTTTLPRFIYGLGIANIGVANAKLLCKYFRNDLDAFMNADTETLSQVDGIGEVIASAIYEYTHNDNNRLRIEALLQEVVIEKTEENNVEQTLEGMVFVITGSLNHFENRNELKEIIENKGGKVTGSVTSKTFALINNDATSQSSKNKKARELGVKVITEDEFIDNYMK